MPVSISGSGSISGLDQGFNVTTGSVGIGTDVVGDKLVIHQGSDDDVIVRVNGADSSSEFAAMGVGSGYAAFVAGGTGTTSTDMVLMTSLSGVETERLRITSNGNIGVGVANPTQKLMVKGIIASEATNSTNNWMAYTYTDNTFRLNYNGAGADEVVITSGGAFGIGANNPDTLLHVRSSDNVLAKFESTDADALIEFKDSSTTDTILMGAHGGDDLLFRCDAGNIKFYLANNNEKLRITSAGLVGIDVTSPATNLDVNGSLQLRASSNSGGYTSYATRIYSRLDSTHCTVIESYLNSSTAFEMMGSYADGGGANPRVVLGAGGQKVGINETAPDRTLHVNSGATDTALKLESTDAEVSLELTDNTGSSYIGGGGSYLNFYSGGNERARISSDGKLCVGTTLTNYGVVQIRDASGDSTTSAIQVENASSGSNTTNVMTRSVSLNSGAWAHAEYRAKSHIFSYQTTSVATIQQHGLTIASQPCFWATSNTGGSDTSDGYTGIISNQMEHAYVNVGNHFNTSTGIFTCPVAGTYEFHGQGLIRYQTGVGRAELSFYKNGSNTISRSYGYTYITGVSDHDNLHVMAYITCAVNDQIDFRVYACDSGIDVYFAQGLGYFAGRLVQ